MADQPALSTARILLVDDNARARLLESSVEPQAHALRGAGLEAARRLAIAAEWHDEQLNGHLARMTKYCELLGRAAGPSR